MISCRSEKGAVYMADGYARITGKPGFVYGQYGPGVSNVAAGLADPYWAMSPVISFTTSMRTQSRDRYEHEWKVFEQVHLPAGKVLIPGLINSCSNYIEHPEVVAQRIVRFAHVVGRENVIAGTDCGFDTFAGASAVAPSISWAKLQSLAEGAWLASQELW
jgi:methionine synthase II (cobalamin-independent)